MAQAWHKPRVRLTSAQGAESTCWRASRYEFTKAGSPTLHVEAAAAARWERYAPFDSYKPRSTTRDVEGAGPHLLFLRLKELWIKQSEHFNEALILFAERYGFLGAFEEDYVPRPIYPEGKALVAPEAVIDDRGRIRRVDPSTEGKDLLLDLLEPALRLLASNETEGIAKARIRHRHLIALPSDIQFIAKPPDLNSIWGPNSEQSFLVPWEVIKERFGALLILDKDAYKGVSVLYTREPRKRWIENLILFPAVDTPAKKLARYKDHISFNSYLEQAAPRAVLGKDGNLERSWNCRSLLQAMYVMLFLDLTGGNTIKKCQSRGCPNYFRVGSQSKSRYCSARCANRASTRMGRGQEP